jgi:hypothetical protein
MKGVVIAFSAGLLFSIGAFAAEEEKRPTAQLTFRVLTDAGDPVENAEIRAATFHHWQPGEGFGKDIMEEMRGATDVDGYVTFTFASLRGDVRYAASGGDAFYRTLGLNYRFEKAEAEIWTPWNPVIEVVLKPILKPVAMYARKVGEIESPLQMPETGKPIGFDLVVSDWVAPFGRGATADLVFKMERSFTDVEQPFEATLTVTFSNDGDGIQSVLAPPFVGSELKLPRFAPEHGYAPELVKRKARPAAGKPIEATTREDQNYFFRVRTVLDEKRQVKSALYGKIDGDIQFWANGKLRFTYYLNPDPNARNMEFDVKRNLLGQLPSLQQPTLP